MDINDKLKKSQNEVKLHSKLFKSNFWNLTYTSGNYTSKSSSIISCGNATSDVRSNLMIDTTDIIWIKMKFLQYSGYIGVANDSNNVGNFGFGSSTTSSLFFQYSYAINLSNGQLLYQNNASNNHKFTIQPNEEFLFTVNMPKKSIKIEYKNKEYEYSVPQVPNSVYIYCTNYPNGGQIELLDMGLL